MLRYLDIKVPGQVFVHAENLRFAEVFFELKKAWGTATLLRGSVYTAPNSCRA